MFKDKGQGQNVQFKANVNYKQVIYDTFYKNISFLTFFLEVAFQIHINQSTFRWA